MLIAPLSRSQSDHASALLPRRVASYEWEYDLDTAAGALAHCAAGEFGWPAGHPLEGYFAVQTHGHGRKPAAGCLPAVEALVQLSTLLFDDPARPELTRRLPRCAYRLSPPTRWTTPGPRQLARCFHAQGYRNADWQAHTIQPDALTGPIGHMGYFRPSSAWLWQEALDWFAQRRSCQHHLPAQPSRPWWRCWPGGQGSAPGWNGIGAGDMRHRLGFTPRCTAALHHRQPLAQLENAAFGQDVLLAGFAKIDVQKTIMPSTTDVTSSAGPAMVPGADQG